MPNWKKVITSGSDAALTSVTATAGFTGSLFGTASYATNALSASYAPSTPAFPYTGSALITGSLGVTGSLSNGDGNIASGIFSHAEGSSTTATGDASHTEGQSTNAIGTYSHAEGLATIASGSYQHVQGQYNIASSAQSAFIVGNGGNIASRSNLIFASGSQVEITGSLTVTAGITGSLLGTASYATQALSASWAPGGAGTPTFPYTGSAIITGSLNVSAGITGSLAGTAATASFAVTSSKSAIQILTTADTRSFALTMVESNTSSSLNNPAPIAIHTGAPLTYTVTGATGILNATASYATSASYAPDTTFPYTGSALITGSLGITGSLFVQDFGKTNIDSSNRYLYDAGPVMPPGAPSVISVNWGSRTLVRSNGATSVDWGNHTLLRGNITTLDWSDKIAYDTSTSSSIKWEARELWDGDPLTNGYNTASLDWNNRIAKDTVTIPSIDWSYRALYDNTGNISLDWKGRGLITPNGITSLNWRDDTFLDSNVYQRDYKSALIQNAVSNNYNNPNVSYLGDVIEVDGHAIFIDNTVTDGMLVYLDTNATWYPVVQATNGSTKLLGIAHNVYAPSGTGFVLLEGHVVIDDTSTSGPYVSGSAYGAPVYIKDSTTTGQMSTAVPTTTGSNIVRVLGHCYQQNGTTTSQWMMKFRPSNDWVQI